MRLNAASSPADKPITIDLGPQYGSMAELKRDCCRKLAQRYNELEAKLFTGEGIELYGEDVFMLQDKDTLYLSPQGGPTPPHSPGAPFDWGIIMNQYQIGRKIG